MLQRQVAAMSEENKKLRRQLAEGQDQERLVEILNVAPGRVSLPNPDDPKKKIHLDGYNSGNERRSVPERFFIYWLNMQLLAIRLGQIRIDRYVFPEEYEVPEEFLTHAYTDDEVLDSYKLGSKQFRGMIEEMAEPEIWKRWYNVGMDEYEKSQQDDAVLKTYPQLASHLQFLEKLIVSNQRELHGYEEGAEDILTFTGETKLSELHRAGRLNRRLQPA